MICSSPVVCMNVHVVITIGVCLNTDTVCEISWDDLAIKEIQSAGNNMKNGHCKLSRLNQSRDLVEKFIFPFLTKEIQSAGKI